MDGLIRASVKIISMANWFTATPSQGDPGDALGGLQVAGKQHPQVVAAAGGVGGPLFGAAGRVQAVGVDGGDAGELPRPAAAGTPRRGTG
jgi:hypothetical protein